jgi:hypothetical protein
MFARLLCLGVLLLLFPRLALAMDPWDPPGACKAETWNDVEQWREWSSHTPLDNARHWAEEKPRYANSRDVWRVLDRLYIAISGGKVLTLSDCAFGDDLHFYLYERYDETGEFHIVRTYFYEDNVHALVMRKTGKVYALPGAPVWSPDRARFAYGVCSVLNDQDEIAIAHMSADGLKTETEARMPCGLGDCEIVWESADTVAATCPKAGEQGKEHKVMRLTRRGGSWTATTSDR